MHLTSLATSPRQRARLAAVLAAAFLAGACARVEPETQTSLGTNGPQELPSQTRPMTAAEILADAGRGIPASFVTRSIPPFQLLKEELRSSGLDLVYFAGDSSTLTSEGRQTLIGQIAWLRQNQVAAIVIEGHADERGTREYNIALGARRAAAVRDFLVAQGIAPDRVTTRSYGKELPIVTCDDIICWAQNRRAQTVPTQQTDMVRSARAHAASVASRPW